MDTADVRTLIIAKLTDGRLPHDSIPRVWGGPGNNETCDACEEIITKQQLVIEGINTLGVGIQFHVSCFGLWDNVRKVEGHRGS
jgi:hypothetical protein